jgi:D-alanyl-lipoteichoic acid acyltransferase DltB (MBOAT superfamily)
MSLSSWLRDYLYIPLGGRLSVGRATGLDRQAASGRGRQALRIVLVFHFVCLCWVFFRAKDMTAAGDILGQLADWSAAPQLVTPFLVGLVILGLLMQATPANLLQWLDRAYHAMSPWAVGVLGGLLLLMIEALGGDGSAPFIYFQF